ncbi:hypothetical protein [Streptomyces sp. 061-3]|uniref:hypothetical protein n=1 Tax=Streptomyces sp. 061-3 TaxID=2789268 RepID=UPI0039810C68
MTFLITVLANTIVVRGSNGSGRRCRALSSRQSAAGHLDGKVPLDSLGGPFLVVRDERRRHKPPTGTPQPTHRTSAQ